MTPFPHLATRLFNVPLAIHPAKAEIVMSALADRLGIAHLFHAEPIVPPAQARPRAFYEGTATADQQIDRPYELVNGVAVLPICGTLVHKGGWMDAMSGVCSYNSIRVAFLTALQDPDAAAIVLDVDTPGGEGAGLFDLVDLIYQSRGDKPIWAIVNEMAFSAGYALASAADRVIIPRTGGVGSVGVLVVHTDLSQALAKDGIKVTFIQYGDRKTDFSPAAPLTDRALADVQARVDALGEIFVATVARNRGMTLVSVRATQAGVYLGADAVAIGFADEVAAPDAAFGALLASL